MQTIEIISPNWPVPTHIIAGVTTRSGGVSPAPFNSLNLADHVGDHDSYVAQNRQLLRQHCLNHLEKCTRQKNTHSNASLQWQWLEQTHSTHVAEIELCSSTPIAADAALTSTPLQVCTVLTADCLPILLCDRLGTCVAAIHAGWRGLANGIVNQALKSFINHTAAYSPAASNDIFAWLGPAIGPNQFEVGDDVKKAFLSESFLNAGVNSPSASSSDTFDKQHHQIGKAAFHSSQQPQKYLADLYALARVALQQGGVTNIYGGDFCTASEPERFFSYRREGVTGRMASFIFMAPKHNVNKAQSRLPIN